MTSSTILVADADAKERSHLVGLLARDCRLALLQAADSDGASAMMLARMPRIDALLLDGRLDGQDGAVLCAALRRRGVAVPILVIGCGTEAAVVRSLDAGANDSIARPFRPAELAARVRAHLRLHEVSEAVVLSVGPYQFHPALRLLQEAESGRRIHLTEKETAVLKFLCRAGGEAVPRRALLHQVWGYSATVASHTVETHMYRLRRKIEPDPDKHRLLVNDTGGYRLILA